jgi:anti-sigma factor RsiW
MECSEPGAIRDEELLAFIDGTQVRPAVRAHLARCQRCSAQAATYQRMDRKLIQRLYRWDCPTNQTLGEYQMGLLSSELAAGVQNHLKKCALCAAEVAMLANFMVNDPLLVEPAAYAQQAATHTQNSHSLRGAKQVLEKWRAEGLASVRRIVATLLPSQPRLAYQRDIVDSTAQWPRRYSAEGLTISIQVQRTPQHVHQRGSLQLLGFVTCDGKALEELQGTSVLLSPQTKVGDKHEQSVQSQAIDDLGNFLFPALEPGTYMLEFQLPEGVVAIEELSLTM